MDDGTRYLGRSLHFGDPPLTIVITPYNIGSRSIATVLYLILSHAFFAPAAFTVVGGAALL